ncbi:MAG: excinuclease ABC subunit UvrA, partial [SAR324 cluster bacterium]|nr:excinuclease ABC subunit UvrA [SAR324 cluster bacterium]
DEETIESADHIVDVGPVAGLNGGEITAQGGLHEIVSEKTSLTGDFLSGRERIEIPEKRRIAENGNLTVRGARFNNLKDLTVEIPLGLFVCVAGVSGSGKSSLIDGVLKKAVANHLIPNSNQTPGEHDKIEGLKNLDRLIEINQTPIGRTPRSNPATYTKMFDPIRDLFALVPESKARGYKKGRFSFNVKGG